MPFALRLEDRGFAQAFGLEDLGALFALRLHLARHGVDEIARRRNVLDLDARHLHAPCLGRVIDNVEQLGVDGVTVGEKLVEVHGSHDRADIGHREVDNRGLQPFDLVGCLRRIEHLEVGHTVDAHHGVVAGDDILARDLHHLLFHVHLVADALHDRDQDVQARSQRARIAAEVLDGPIVALRNDLHGRPERHRRKDDQQEAENLEATKRLHCPVLSCALHWKMRANLPAFIYRNSQNMVNER